MINYSIVLLENIFVNLGIFKQMKQRVYFINLIHIKIVFAVLLVQRNGRPSVSLVPSYSFGILRALVFDLMPKWFFFTNLTDKFKQPV